MELFQHLSKDWIAVTLLSESGRAQQVGSQSVACHTDSVCLQSHLTETCL